MRPLNDSRTPAGAGRDHRLDVLRGIALVMIFINHVPGNVYEQFTSRNFGFSDAAEAFVLMSGIATALAYSGPFRAGDFRLGAGRVWRRALTLYKVHLSIMALALVLVSAAALALGAVKLARALNVGPFLADPLAALAGMATLTYQIGYFDILPLYIVLLFAAPLFLALGLRNPPAMLALAFVVWFASGLFRLNFPRFFGEGGWQFNPLAWQLLFAIGLAGGLAAKGGGKLVAFRPRLLACALAWLAFSVVWAAARIGPLPGAAYLPSFLLGFDKPFLALPRLLHVVALAYVLTNLDAVGKILATPLLRPIALMGQQSLAVFATGSVLAITLQVVRNEFPTDAAVDGLLLSGGLLIQYGVARLVAAQKRPASPARAGSTLPPDRGDLALSRK